MTFLGDGMFFLCAEKQSNIEGSSVLPHHPHPFLQFSPAAIVPTIGSRSPLLPVAPSASRQQHRKLQATTFFLLSSLSCLRFIETFFFNQLLVAVDQVLKFSLSAAGKEEDSGKHNDGLVKREIAHPTASKEILKNCLFNVSFRARLVPIINSASQIVDKTHNVVGTLKERANFRSVWLLHVEGISWELNSVVSMKIWV